jgi:hypothetical protein
LGLGLGLGWGWTVLDLALTEPSGKPRGADVLACALNKQLGNLAGWDPRLANAGPPRPFAVLTRTDHDRPKRQRLARKSGEAGRRLVWVRRCRRASHSRQGKHRPPPSQLTIA